MGSFQLPELEGKNVREKINTVMTVIFSQFVHLLEEAIMGLFGFWGRNRMMEGMTWFLSFFFSLIFFLLELTVSLSV